MANRALRSTLATLLAIAFVGSFAVLPLTGGRAVPAGNHLYQLWLLLLLAAYFWLSWRFGGQTLGMRAWRLRVTASDGRPAGNQALLQRLFLLSVCVFFIPAMKVFNN